MKKSTVLLLMIAVFLNGFSSFAMSTHTHSNVIVTPKEPNDETVKFAFKELMNLSRHERKLRIKEAKAEIKNLKMAKKAGENVSTNQVLLIVLAILLPPLAVYLHEGVINNKFWIDLLLTLLLFLPGIIYALIVILGKA